MGDLVPSRSERLASCDEKYSWVRSAYLSVSMETMWEQSKHEFVCVLDKIVDLTCFQQPMVFFFVHRLVDHGIAPLRYSMVQDANALSQVGKISDDNPSHFFGLGFRLNLLKFLIPRDCDVLEVAHILGWTSISGGVATELSEPSVMPVEDVIQEIQHDEPGVPRDPEVAATQVQAQADEEFANLAEMRLALPDPTTPSQVHLVSYRSGKGELFRKMLIHGPEFSSLRKSLKERGFPIMLTPSTTLVLVPPEQYLATINSPTLHSKVLKRYSMLLAESHEHLIDEVLMRMSAKQRPYENKRARTQVELDIPFNTRFVYKRTFIQLAKNHLVSGTTASTTEAVRTDSSTGSGNDYLSHSQGGNPRKRVAHWDDC